MDENFLDVTSLLSAVSEDDENVNLVGHSYNNENPSERECQCGCDRRLKIGSRLAKQFRDRLKSEFSITSSAGIAHNKVLAKMVGSQHKPDDQTTIFPCDVTKFISEIENVEKIPGIGSAMSKILTENNLGKIHQVQQANLLKLSQHFEASTAKRILELCRGEDTSEVRMSGAPKSIGLEDRFKGLYTRKECIEKLEWLLDRLSILLHEDGRLPTVIKVSARDYFKDKFVKKFHRESRQCQINADLFRSLNCARELELPARAKIFAVIVHLLEKMVEMEGKFHLTLLGISVSAFQNSQCSKKHEISNFFTNSNTSNDCASQTQTSKVREKSPGKSHFLHERGEKWLIQENLSLVDDTRHKRKFFAGNETDGASKATESLTKKAKHGSSSSSVVNGVCLPLKIPVGWDKDIFTKLPADVQLELLREQKLSFSDPQLQYDTATTKRNQNNNNNSSGFSTSKSKAKSKSCTAVKNIRSYFKKK